MRFSLGLLCGAYVTCALGAAARPTEALAFDSPEAWALEYYATASLLTDLGPPATPWLHLATEAGTLPTLSRAQTTVGFGGTKAEALNRASFFGRPRLIAGLPLGFSLQLAWVPPIPLHGARANLFSGSVSKAFRFAGFSLAIDALGQVGQVSGDFTCPASVVSDPAQNLFLCDAPSKDVATLDYAGLAATFAYRIAPAYGVTPYLSAHVTYLHLSFDVNAHYDGFFDQSRLNTDGVTFASALGLAVPLGDRFRLSAEAFYSPLLVKRSAGGDTDDGFFNLRAMISGRLW